jgi:hypothetical protein
MSTTSNIVSDSITFNTTDAGAKIVLDQDAEFNKIEITTDHFSKGILLQNDPTTFLELRGGNAALSTSNGNLQLITSQLFMTGSGMLAQNMLTVNNSITVDPADPLYDELNTTGAPGINVISRVHIVPDTDGTTIKSIVTGSPNPDGRVLWIHNLGTSLAQTLTLAHLAPAGTAGGLILAPRLVDYNIPAGGGVCLIFNGSRPDVDGIWLVDGV